MEIEKQTIEKIDNRIWQIVVAVLSLTMMLLALQYLGSFQKSLTNLSSMNFHKHSILLTMLILLFSTYMIIHRRKLLKLYRALYEEKASVQILDKNVKTLSELLEVKSCINSQQKLSDILNTISKQVLSCFKADHISIMLLDERSSMFKTTECFGKGYEFAKNALVPMGKSMAGRVLQHGNPLLLNGQVNPADFPGNQKKNRRIYSSLCVPLIAGEKKIGVLSMNLLDRGRTFSECDLKLITIFAKNAAVAINNAMILKEQNGRSRMQTMFEETRSHQMDQTNIMKSNDRDRPKRMAEKLKMTILFADIRGLSNVMAVHEPEEIMDFLDQFYSAMNKIVSHNKGSIEKLIGDGVMAFFETPGKSKNSSENGVKTAMEMLLSFHELKQAFSINSSDFDELEIGIGVDTGEVFVGNVGSTEHSDYTVTGSAVNLARALSCYAEPDQILTTERTLNQGPGMVSSELVKNISLLGICEPVNIYKITPSSNSAFFRSIAIYCKRAA